MEKRKAKSTAISVPIFSPVNLLCSQPQQKACTWTLVYAESRMSIHD